MTSQAEIINKRRISWIAAINEVEIVSKPSSLKPCQWYFMKRNSDALFHFHKKTVTPLLDQREICQG